MLTRNKSRLLLAVAAMVTLAVVGTPFAAPAFAQGCCYTVHDCENVSSPSSYCVFGEFCDIWNDWAKCGPIDP